jgi:Domain of unknown function (DUF397)
VLQVIPAAVGVHDGLLGAGFIIAAFENAPHLPGIVAVRDSKDPDGPVLAFNSSEWRAFTAGVKAGEYDLS